MSYIVLVLIVASIAFYYLKRSVEQTFWLTASLTLIFYLFFYKVPYQALVDILSKFQYLEYIMSGLVILFVALFVKLFEKSSFESDIERLLQYKYSNYVLRAITVYFFLNIFRFDNFLIQIVFLYAIVTLFKVTKQTSYAILLFAIINTNFYRVSSQLIVNYKVSVELQKMFTIGNYVIDAVFLLLGAVIVIGLASEKNDRKFAIKEFITIKNFLYVLGIVFVTFALYFANLDISSGQLLAALIFLAITVTVKNEKQEYVRNETYPIVYSFVLYALYLLPILITNRFVWLTGYYVILSLLLYLQKSRLRKYVIVNPKEFKKITLILILIFLVRATASSFAQNSVINNFLMNTSYFEYYIHQVQELSNLGLKAIGTLFSGNTLLQYDFIDKILEVSNYSTAKLYFFFSKTISLVITLNFTTFYVMKTMFEAEDDEIIVPITIGYIYAILIIISTLIVTVI